MLFSNFSTLGWAMFRQHDDVVQFLKMQKNKDGEEIFHLTKENEQEKLTDPLKLDYKRCTVVYIK